MSLGVILTTSIVRRLLRDRISEIRRYTSVGEFIDSLEYVDAEAACFYIGQGIMKLLILMLEINHWRSFCVERVSEVCRFLLEKGINHLVIQKFTNEIE